jgi:RNA polymerase sigma-70 factor (ECF subfamily)
MRELSDVELALQAQQGDVQAIGVLYDRHQLRIYRYVRSRIYDEQTAHDLTGDVFLRMVYGLPKYRPMEAPFTAWLYRIAHNLVVSHIQKENMTRVVPIQEAESNYHTAVNPLTLVEQQLELEAVLSALAELEEDQQEVLRLRFLAGLSLQEVAAALGKSVAAVKSSQHRGLKMMKVMVVH